MNQVQMDQEQIYTRCEYFTLESCPYRNTKAMNTLIDDLDIAIREVQDIISAETVNKMFCNTCGSFKDNQR